MYVCMCERERSLRGNLLKGRRIRPSVCVLAKGRFFLSKRKRRRKRKGHDEKEDKCTFSLYGAVMMRECDVMSNQVGEDSSTEWRDAKI